MTLARDHTHPGPSQVNLGRLAGTVIDSGYGDRVRSAQLTRAALLQNVVAQYVVCQTLLGKCVDLLGAVHGSAWKFVIRHPHEFLR